MNILTDQLLYDENWWTEQDTGMRADGDKMGHRRISIEGVVAALQCFVVDGEMRGYPLVVDAVTGVYEHLKEGQRNARNTSQPLAVFSIWDDAIQSHAITFLIAVVHVLLDAETNQEPSDTPHIEIHVSRYSMAILTTAHHMLHVKDMLASSLPYVTGWFGEHLTELSMHAPSPASMTGPPHLHSVPIKKATTEVVRFQDLPPSKASAIREEPVATSTPKPGRETVIRELVAQESKGIQKVALFAYGTDDRLKDSWLKDRGPYEIQHVQTPEPFFGVWHDKHDTFDAIAQFEAPEICAHMIRPNQGFTPDIFFQRYIRSIIIKLKPEGVFYVSKDVCELNKAAFGSIDITQQIDDRKFTQWSREQLMRAAAKNVETHSFIHRATRKLTTLQPPLACRDVVSEEVLRSLDGDVLDRGLINFFINQCVTTWWPGGDKLTMLNVNAIHWDDWMNDPRRFLNDLHTLPNNVIFPAFRENHWFGCFPAECRKTPRYDGGRSGQERKQITRH